MDASHCQLGEVINQGVKTIALYSCKLTGPQTRYTVTEAGFISIVETLQEFHTIL